MWFGYCQVIHLLLAILERQTNLSQQGVFAGVLVSDDFLELFPQTSNANISGIVTSCFLVSDCTRIISARNSQLPHADHHP
jgi:hypothetical protein